MGFAILMPGFSHAFLFFSHVCCSNAGIDLGSVLAEFMFRGFGDNGMDAAKGITAAFNQLSPADNGKAKRDNQKNSDITWSSSIFQKRSNMQDAITYQHAGGQQKIHLLHHKEERGYLRYEITLMDFSDLIYNAVSERYALRLRPRSLRTILSGVT
ncbi:hypothetical protein M621_22420 [Serratia plymuthica S13]|uniref:Uncharacterized protein n=1 Tax=Serratia plymuthica S13 TaxID=1348660 RepID=S4YPZ1_SERPL|nr:hypothetical protein M621_22420 [Serratia plymuthica S13]